MKVSYSVTYLGGRSLYPEKPGLVTCPGQQSNKKKGRIYSTWPHGEGGQGDPVTCLSLPSES